jgi:hypothetical protein
LPLSGIVDWDNIRRRKISGNKVGQPFPNSHVKHQFGKKFQSCDVACVMIFGKTLPIFGLQDTLWEV